MAVRMPVLEVEGRASRGALPWPAGVGWRERIVGRSPAMERVLELIERVAPLRVPVLIVGETGVGKELVAQAIHEASGVRGPFVPVHCAALPEGLLESELFGHVRGSFTGAVATRRGLFEEAAGGTLFLDEISTIAPAVQVKLLRVLQDRAVRRVGSNQAVPVDFRLVAATNVELADEVAAGRFREDLYYRLAVFPIRVPPLRERRSDIPVLARHFLDRFAEENGLEAPEIPPAVLRRMLEYPWPGNVRELENAVERALVLSAGSRWLSLELPGVRGPGPPAVLERARQERWDLARLEREYILCVLDEVRGHRGRAAQVLGIDRRTLYRKLKGYGLGA